MAILLGEAFRLSVETVTPGTFVAVNGMDEWEQSGSATIDTFPSFGAATPLGIPTPTELTFTLSGFYDPTDAGQVRLRLIAQNRTTVVIKVLHDGTNGYTVEVRVGSRTVGASASGGPQTQSFEFAPSATPVVVGTGQLP